MYKKILVPLDGSALAEAPLDYVARLALKTPLEITLLNIYRGKRSSMSHYLKQHGQMLYLRSHEHKGAQLPPVVREVSVQGDAATEILKYADEKSIDMIAMSTHGHSGIKHWLMGSVADRVVRYSHRPVWLLKSFVSIKKTEYDRSVLVLLDGSEFAEQILPYAAYHAGLSGGELILLNVCEPPDVIPAVTYHLIPDSYPPKRPLQWSKYVREETERRAKKCKLYLEQKKEVYSGNNYTVQCEHRLGEPSAEISDYLENNPVSLIAMTTRGRTGLARWAFGNTAEKILSIATSPILIMRPSESELRAGP